MRVRTLGLYSWQLMIRTFAICQKIGGEELQVNSNDRTDD